MSVALKKLNQTISEDSHNATSSPAAADGRLPCDSRESLTPSLFGPHHVTVNRGALQEKNRAIKTNATFGRVSFGSSQSANLQRCLENKLRERFVGDGSTEPSMILRKRVTPAGRRLCELVPLARTMNASGSSLWPTPAARDGKDLSRTTAYLAARTRHSPSMATRLLGQGAPWRVITGIYCLAMGYPSKWNETRLKSTAMQSFHKSRKPSSKAT